MSTGDCWSVSCSPYRHRPVVQLPSAQQDTAQPGHCSGCKQCHPDTHSSPYTSNKQDISSLTRTHSWNLHFKHRWHEQKACFASFIIDAAMIKASSTLTRQGAEEILFWSSGKMSKPANKKNECKTNVTCSFEINFFVIAKCQCLNDRCQLWTQLSQLYF